MREVEPDTGQVERQRRLRVACLSQLPRFEPEDTVFDVTLRSFSEILQLERQLMAIEEQLSQHSETLLKRYSLLREEFQRRGGYEFRTRVKQVLHGLGFTLADYDLRAAALSGGQRTRLMLALVLLQDADLLLLDEPENHLDMEAREWLEGFLQSRSGAFVVISHDRRMLNAVVHRIVEAERGELREYPGNYDAYATRKALLREQHREAYERQQERIEKEERWINRFRYKATKAAQAQSRIKRLERMDRLDAPDSEAATAHFTTGKVVRSGVTVLEAEGLGMAYGPLRLYEGLSLRVERGERVGVIGPNGAGKTTLLRHLAGRLPDATGKVTLGHKVRLGFYDQHHEALDSAADILSETGRSRPDWSTEQIRTFLGRFLFTGDDVFKPINTLSGGELSRVALAKLILSGSNVLLLDEPTNHLDIASREALEGALEQYPGTLIVVSHDRALIDRLVTGLVIIDHGKAQLHLGNYTHYRWKHREAQTEDRPKSTVEVLQIRRAGKRTRGKEEEKVRRKRRQQLEDLERDIAEVEEMIAGFEARFAALDPADYEAANQLKDEYEGLKSDLNEMYAEWERLAEQPAT
jgi:ATP-binding cassette subfamily F protein 3